MCLKKKIRQAQSLLEAEAIQQKINLPPQEEVVVEATSKVMIMELSVIKQHIRLLMPLRLALPLVI